MEVILLDKVHKLGGLGDQVKVRPGYARNFLIPRGKAVLASKENREYFEARRKELEEKVAGLLAVAQARAEKLAGMTVEIAKKAGDEGKLFGSVGAADIADALTAAGMAVEKQEISLPEGPVRAVGEYVFDVHLHADVTTNVTVNVVPEA